MSEDVFDDGQLLSGAFFKGVLLDSFQDIHFLLGVVFERENF